MHRRPPACSRHGAGKARPSARVGFASVVAVSDQAELIDLFLEPDHIGTGIGATLWRHAVDAAARKGAQRLRIESDPHAESW
ncbi:MAG: GNAT family N-acetyltransferase [Actinomycetota bacterium]